MTQVTVDGVMQGPDGPWNALIEPRWANTTVIFGDVAAAIGELKAKPGVSCRCTAAVP